MFMLVQLITLVQVSGHYNGSSKHTNTRISYLYRTSWHKNCFFESQFNTFGCENQTAERVYTFDSVSFCVLPAYFSWHIFESAVSYCYMLYFWRLLCIPCFAENCKPIHCIYYLFVQCKSYIFVDLVCHIITTNDNVNE